MSDSKSCHCPMCRPNVGSTTSGSEGTGRSDSGSTVRGQMIPVGAVEAAAEAMHDRDAYAELFEDAPEHRRARYLDAAREILEAAAPHLMAQAWSEGHGAGRADPYCLDRNTYEPESV